MKIALLDAKEVGKQLSKLISDFDEFHWAVAWGSNGPLSDELLANKKKIRHILLGVHFCQTDPALLERLITSKESRVALDIGNGTFHPKIYYFQIGDRAAAIVGSANFTRAGVSSNIESALLLEGKTDDKPLSDIRMKVESLWAKGSAIDSTFLASYRLQYAANRRHREALMKPPRINRARTNATHPNLLAMSWREYVNAVKNAPNSNLVGRLKMLRKAQTLLNGADTFAHLGLEERKAIAGVIGRNEKFGNELDDFDWGWFGSMIGAGAFRNRIAENDSHLSSALEHIPSTGEVARDDYHAFIEEFKLAFEHSARQGRIPTASRLLAIKRPDVFPCIDNKNVRGMSNDLGFARTTLDFDKYWTEIVEPINHASWWQVRRPTGIDGRIWDARAAMLDVIYYDPA